MLTITHDVSGFGLTDATPMEMDVQLDGLALSRHAAAKLRDVLGVPAGLTAEQVEEARLKAELDAAVADGRIAGWSYCTTGKGHSTVVQQQGELSWGNLRDAPGSAGSMVDALRAAVAYVRTLPVPEPAPRDVDEMNCTDCNCELRESGWVRVSDNGWTGYVRGSAAIPVTAAGLSDATTAYRDAVRKARELDAEAQP
jgi:hypothetical protein